MEAGRILEVGRWEDLRRRGGSTCHDLGDVALLPGLVNAHCHLAYTCLAGSIPPPSSFTGWIHSIKAAKDTCSEAELQASWRQGAEMLLRNGVTTVGDAEAFPGLLPGTARATPLQVLPFLELIRIRADLDAMEPVHQARETLARLGRAGLRAGLSPHAPYSTTPALLRACARESAANRLRLMIHVAESREEFDMFLRGRGPLHDWLQANGRDVSDCDGTSPVAQLARTGVLGPATIAVHVNYLAEGDAALLGESGTSVVHCPRSHDYFGHEPFPLARLQAAGVGISLGTDSLATTRTSQGRLPELDLLPEMALFSRRHPGVPPGQILHMATAGGAATLGLAGEVGAITAGGRADFLLVPATGDVPAVLEALVGGAMRPCGVILGGNRFGAEEEA